MTHGEIEIQYQKSLILKGRNQVSFSKDDSPELARLNTSVKGNL
jgi:hypothetical protein